MQTEWIIAVLAGVCVVFFLLSKKNSAPPDKMSSVYNKQDGAVRNFRFELEAIAELAVKKLEEKISRLDYLIEEAEEKSNQLDAKIKLVNDILGHLKVEGGEVSWPAETGNNKSWHKTQAQPLAAQGAMRPGGTDFSETLRQENAFSGAPGKDFLNNEKHRVALNMIKEGYSVLDIAKVTSLGKGEIMLLKGLRDRKQ